MIIDNKIPAPNDLWFLPLGGTGEIGMNLNLIGHDGQWLMVDCGLSFNVPLDAELDAEARTPGSILKTHSVVCADSSFIDSRRDRLAGIVITHAHEDHLGALIDLYPKFGGRLFMSEFTAEVFKRKLYREGIDILPLITLISPGLTLAVGPFQLTWFAMTHSIPEPTALLIETAAGRIFHSGDWKIDDHPVVGDGFDAAPLRRLAERPVDVMLCDSTNALKPGHSISEGELEPALLDITRRATGRVVVSCFASNLARLVTLARVAAASERHFALLGRSLETMYSIARSCGYWPDDLKVIERRHVGYLPAHEVFAVATGSQGEPRAALWKLATDAHPNLDLAASDTVIFSSIKIPGNERAIERLTHLLVEKEIQVVHAEQSENPIHASGHPCQDELFSMYQWVKPRCVIPVHGEAEHLAMNAQVATRAGVSRTLVGKNGDLFVISPQMQIRRQFIKPGRIVLRDS